MICVVTLQVSNHLSPPPLRGSRPPPPSSSGPASITSFISALKSSRSNLPLSSWSNFAHAAVELQELDGTRRAVVHAEVGLQHDEAHELARHLRVGKQSVVVGVEARELGLDGPGEGF
ncbi:hypothetical protein BHE74_00001568 [Ensete ventricosum]|nr:hypothetical protein BHE74_00001568 [Ensete ventricosum]